ncbi:hypothetical protein BABINDRAFT_174954 [Babjeviella inositovora NRRL Y-12698]|uniref:Calponin-homology (CH) domain-containing protein n=1 Tax=Babjeviella inositovora NRRL Y-12698 TaxID=984486 RepID=A0A1E3QU08_9ASCO|nr:uncharacterized protein BABINDRAFT_174954 [Babjeviella inositovora NRRL Y-12698]ODQ81175.1 hypothetical protein BABINDRAFT_174954 [Babjeviella inositovora NRRL Y-12698]
MAVPYPYTTPLSKSAKDALGVQHKTFLRWINMKLKTNLSCLTKDFSDGMFLSQLVNTLALQDFEFKSANTKYGSSERLCLVKLIHEKPKLKFQALENINAIFEYLRFDAKIQIRSIGAQDIVEGNLKLILGLIWLIFIRYTAFRLPHIDDPRSSGVSCRNYYQDSSGIKKSLLAWYNKLVPPLDKELSDFSISWKDGTAFCNLFSHMKPDLLNYATINHDEVEHNIRTVFLLAQTHMGIPMLLDFEDLDCERPDEKSVMTYVFEWYRYYARHQYLKKTGGDSDSTGTRVLISCSPDLSCSPTLYDIPQGSSITEAPNVSKETSRSIPPLESVLTINTHGRAIVENDTFIRYSPVCIGPKKIPGDGLVDNVAKSPKLNKISANLLTSKQDYEAKASQLINTMALILREWENSTAHINTMNSTLPKTYYTLYYADGASEICVSDIEFIDQLILTISENSDYLCKIQKQHQAGFQRGVKLTLLKEKITLSNLLYKINNDVRLEIANFLTNHSGEFPTPKMYSPPSHLSLMTINNQWEFFEAKQLDFLDIIRDSSDNMYTFLKLATWFYTNDLISSVKDFHHEFYRIIHSMDIKQSYSNITVVEFWKNQKKTVRRLIEEYFEPFEIKLSRIKRLNDLEDLRCKKGSTYMDSIYPYYEVEFEVNLIRDSILKALLYIENQIAITNEESPAFNKW